MSNKRAWRGVEIELAELKDICENLVEIPNEWLPTPLHDNVRGGRTVQRLNELLDVEEAGQTEHQRKKAIKARNIEKYRQQVKGHDIDCEFDRSDMEQDLNQLYKNEQMLIEGMVNGGLLDSDDFIEWE